MHPKFRTPERSLSFSLFVAVCRAPGAAHGHHALAAALVLGRLQHIEAQRPRASKNSMRIANIAVSATRRKSPVFGRENVFELRLVLYIFIFLGGKGHETKPFGLNLRAEADIESEIDGGSLQGFWN